MAKKIPKIVIMSALAVSPVLANPTRLNTGFNSSASLNDWNRSTNGVNWLTNDSGIVRVLSRRGAGEYLKREDLNLGSAYNISMKIKIISYGSSPFFIYQKSGGRELRVKVQSNGVWARTTTGWLRLGGSEDAIASGYGTEYVDISFVVDGDYANYFLDGELIASFTPMLGTESDQFTFSAYDTSTTGANCRISSFSATGTSSYSGNLSSWKSEELNTLSAPFPNSPMADANSSWTSSVSENTDYSGSEWFEGLDESTVYQAVLKHNQGVGSKYVAGRSWEMRIGKGGQIYSLINNAVGETMPPQAPAGSRPFNNYTANAKWMDEVWQPTCLSTTDSKMHVYQVGNYTTEETDYAPLVIAGAPNNKSYVAVNWSQQAKTPSTHRADLITYQKYRDVGSGIIEVTYVWHNYGELKLNRFSAPWGGVRRSTFDNMYNGSELQGFASFGSGFGNIELKSSETPGWIAYADDTGSNALGIVTGLDHTPWDADQYWKSVWRWGHAGGNTTYSSEADWRNYLVGTRKLLMDVNQGETLFARYYMVVGAMGAVEAYTNAYGLVTKADYGKISYTAANTETLNWYIDSNGLLTTDRQSGQDVWVSTYASPVAGSKPLFYVRSTTSNNLFVTTNPNLLSEVPEDATIQPVPSDGFTEHVGLLGYVIED